jgi:hypothetical protein
MDNAKPPPALNKESHEQRGRWPTMCKYLTSFLSARVLYNLTYKHLQHHHPPRAPPTPTPPSPPSPPFPPAPSPTADAGWLVWLWLLFVSWWGRRKGVVPSWVACKLCDVNTCLVGQSKQGRAVLGDYRGQASL